MMTSCFECKTQTLSAVPRQDAYIIRQRHRSTGDVMSSMCNEIDSSSCYIVLLRHPWMHFYHNSSAEYAMSIPFPCVPLPSHMCVWSSPSLLHF